jgi:tight adherence protein C
MLPGPLVGHAVLTAAELASMLVFLVVFAAVLGAPPLLRWVCGDHRRALARLRDPAPESGAAEKPGWASPALSALSGPLGTLVAPGDAEHLRRLKVRLTEAGVYGPNAVTILLGAQLLLLVLLPVTVGGLPLALGLLSWKLALFAGLVALGVGFLTPTFWVEYQQNKRQAELRRALADALDMLVLCAEAGLNLPAALQRVTAEMQVVHPALAWELNVIQREVQLGVSVGDAFKKFGDRCNLPEVRELAAVLQQSERYGVGYVKALRSHSDTCRQQRQQRAEERARKAAVKILYPALLCICPAVLLVLLGPAAYQLASMLANTR